MAREEVEGMLALAGAPPQNAYYVDREQTTTKGYEPKGVDFMVNFIFTRDFDDSYKKYKNKEYEFVPRVGDCVHINGYHHRVVDVVWESSTGQATVYLGKSAPSLEDAKGPNYGMEEIFPTWLLNQKRNS